MRDFLLHLAEAYSLSYGIFFMTSDSAGWRFSVGVVLVNTFVVLNKFIRDHK